MKGSFFYILGVIIVFFVGCSIIVNDKCTRIDITGNWQDNNGFPVFIQSREPALKKGELKIFTQQLSIPKGDYKIIFEYDQQNGQEPGTIFENGTLDFKGFKINGEIQNLNFSTDSIDKSVYKVYRAEYKFVIREAEKSIKLELAINNTRAVRTWLEGSSFPTTNKNYFAVDPGNTKEYLLVRDIPFLISKSDIHDIVPWFSCDELRGMANKDRGDLKNWNNGMFFNLKGTKVDRLHFLGMIHNIDIANGSWYSPKGDNGYSHFIGDKAGEIIITFVNKSKAIVPLIFGVNLWYSRPWDIFWCYSLTTPDTEGPNYDSTMFSGIQSYKDLIQNTVSLVDGTRLMGSASNNTRFIFSLEMEGKEIKSIEIKGVDNMHGHPLISAITIETSKPSYNLSELPDISISQPVTKPVTLQYILNEEYKSGIEKLKRKIYTYKDELPKLNEPEIPDNYFGPHYNFKGTQEAVYAATYLYRNGPECGAKIADCGTGCASSIAAKQTIHYALGLGIWRDEPSLFGNLQNWFKLYKTKSPGNLPGIGSAWSRGIGELMREAMAFGYGKFVNTYTDWLDSCLFRDANPPHWIRVPGMRSESPAYETRRVGDIIETGNRENDGHGICMMGRYMTYHWSGHPPFWNEKHWKATKSAVDWIQWQLETDTIFPGKRKDVLYTESECGNYEFYGSYNCLHGIGLSIIMAKDLGKNDVVATWTKLYKRLQSGILNNLVDSSEFGPVWHTKPELNWNDDAQKMAHIQLAADGITLTPLQDYALADSITQHYLKIDVNSYRYLLKNKNYNCLRMFGYGQGMMTQAALLMDEMNDAENFINVMVDHCYLPRLEGWTAPEGIILHKSGEYWVPVNGYMGQDSHLADSQKALRLMLGIDDNNSDHVRIIPRYPSSWNQMSIKDFPVLTENKRQKINYSYTRDDNGQVFKFEFESSVKNMSLRLGPIPEGKVVSKAIFNSEKLAFENLVSGDSKWVWIKNLSGKMGEVKIQYK